MTGFHSFPNFVVVSHFYLQWKKYFINTAKGGGVQNKPENIWLLFCLASYMRHAIRLRQIADQCGYPPTE
jgi:hypothetical protein